VARALSEGLAQSVVYAQSFTRISLIMIHILTMPGLTATSRFAAYSFEGQDGLRWPGHSPKALFRASSLLNNSHE